MIGFHQDRAAAAPVIGSTAVSTINGCGPCLDAHEGALRKHGVPATQVQTALRIGAVVHAAGRIAASEAALAG